MYRCGILLLSLAVALGSPPKKTVQPTTGPDTDQDQDSDFEFNESCIFGSPPILCTLRCMQQNLKPFCDQKEQCTCVPLVPAGGHGDEPQDIQSGQEASQTSTTSPESDGTDNDDDGGLHMIFYIFDLSTLFGGDNETAITPTETATTLSPVPIDDLQTMEETVTLKGWASAHLLAVVIVALLSVLVLVELFACLKKQKAKHKEANMFNSLGVQNKS